MEAHPIICIYFCKFIQKIGKPLIPLNFIHSRLMEEYFRGFVIKSRKVFDRNSRYSAMKQFVDILKGLKVARGDWAKNHALTNQKKLKEVEV